MDLTGYTGPALRYAVTGEARPRPTVLTLALNADATIAAPYSLLADQLVARGWLSVTLNLPGHGGDARPGENPDTPLITWRDRILAGEHLVADFAERVAQMQDGLVACGASTGRLVIVGVSRGGFLGAHVAAALPGRVAGLVLLVPVTDLAALDEFAGVRSDLRLQALRLHPLARRLRMPIWVKSGSTDTRIDQAQTVAFVEAVQDAGGTIQHTIDPTYGHSLNPLPLLTTAAEWVRLLLA